LPESANSQAFNSVSAFYLRDPTTGTEYIPLRDTDQRPLTAGVGVYLRAGTSYPVWAYFPAPPATTSKVTVVVPGGSASVTDVPISATPPAP
jgi:hypothetical protein